VSATRQRFGKYHVLERIAQGGMAELYKVKTVGIAGFEKIQALKRILPESAREERFIRSFIDEARIAVELNHRNIVQVFDFGKADGELYLAMELIDGKDLRSALTLAQAAQVRLPIGVSAHIIAEAAAGLHYAHRKVDGSGRSLGIVHCDVSPSNIMLSTDGYVKVLDFGIARASFSSAMERKRLRGKPRYMAPEQTRGEAPTPATDVFALAVIAWELLSGRPLFAARDLRMVLLAVRKAEVPPLGQVSPRTPPYVVEAVMRALRADPADRGTAADLVAACTRAAVGVGARGLAYWLESVIHPRTPVSIPAVQIPTAGAASVPTEDSSAGTSESSAIVEAAPEADAASSQLQLAGETLGHGTATLSFVMLGELLQRSPPPPATGQFGNEGDEATSRGGDPPPAMISPPSEFGDERTQSEHAHAAMMAAITESSRTDGDAFQDPDQFIPELISPKSPGVAGNEPIDDPIAHDPASITFERRRIVTAVACLDRTDEELGPVISRSLGELAYQRGGVLLSSSAAEVVVGFGLEVAGEDDVAVAMAWALDAAVMARDAGSLLGVGAQAATLVGADDVGRPRVPPEAIEQARRLAQAARPERPLLSGTSGRLTHALYALHEVSAPRTVAAGSRVYEVRGTRTFDDRDQQLTNRRGRFIGRSAIMAELRATYARVRVEPTRQAVLLVGPAGAGKTRIISELVAHARSLPPRPIVTWATAGPGTRLTPFALVTDLFLSALGLPPVRGRSGRSQAAKRLAEELGRTKLNAAVARSIIADLTRAMELRDGSGLGVAETANLRECLATSLALFRSAVASPAAPALWIVEDLHDADSASLEVLRLLLSRHPGTHELVILCTRNTTTTLRIDQVIAVPELEGTELTELVQDRLGAIATPDLVTALVTRAGGNPLFIEELATALADSDRMGAIPESARDVIRARLDRLSPAAKTLVKYAAVLGSTARLPLLEELVDGGDLSQELEELIASGLLIRDMAQLDDPDGPVLFGRGLFREVAYESLPARAQRDAHGHVGRLLASRYFAGRDEPPAVIAEHLERGGELAGAAAFWLRAGRLAMTASEPEAAVTLFSRCLAVEAQLGASPATDAGRARRREALAGREHANFVRGDLLSHSDDLRQLALLSEDDPHRVADLELRSARRALRGGDLPQALSAAQRAQAAAAGVDAHELHAHALAIRSEIFAAQARIDEAVASARAARDLYGEMDAMGEATATAFTEGRWSLMAGRVDDTRELFRHLLGRVTRLSAPKLAPVMRHHVARLQLASESYPEAFDSVTRAGDQYRAAGERGLAAEALALKARVAAAMGLYDQARDWFHSALPELERLAPRWIYCEALIHAGTCELRAGRRDGAALIEDGVAAAARCEARYAELEGRLAQAYAQLQQARPDLALEHASIAVATAQKHGLVNWEIVALAREALARRGLGQNEVAVERAQAAIQLLDRHRHAGTSSDEVLWACSSVLLRAGHRDLGGAVRERARQSVLRKLAGMANAEWKQAFATIVEHRALLDQRRSASQPDLG
jgi:serine/threonine protein kinase/tetratricopeptide (TPR) repeat protein